MTIAILSAEYQGALEAARKWPTEINLATRDRVLLELEILMLRRDMDEQ